MINNSPNVTKVFRLKARHICRIEAIIVIYGVFVSATKDVGNPEVLFESDKTGILDEGFSPIGQEFEVP